MQIQILIAGVLAPVLVAALSRATREQRERDGADLPRTVALEGSAAIHPLPAAETPKRRFL